MDGVDDAEHRGPEKQDGDEKEAEESGELVEVHVAFHVDGSDQALGGGTNAEETDVRREARQEHDDDEDAVVFWKEYHGEEVEDGECDKDGEASPLRLEHRDIADVLDLAIEQREEE